MVNSILEPGSGCNRRVLLISLIGCFTILMWITSVTILLHPSSSAMEKLIAGKSTDELMTRSLNTKSSSSYLHSSLLNETGLNLGQIASTTIVTSTLPTALPTQFITTKPIVSPTDTITEPIELPSLAMQDPYRLNEWKQKFARKLLCRQFTLDMGYYLYHTRKAAGTAIQEIIKRSALRNRLTYFETEGKTLNGTLTTQPSLITVTSLRDPVERILSLYWYEHVSWYETVLKQSNHTLPIHRWIEAWRDGGSLKQQIQRDYPTNNYVEIENYYVKMLVGWNATVVSGGSGVVGRKELERAKEILSHFDVILIMEWLQENEVQQKFLNFVFPLISTSQQRYMQQVHAAKEMAHAKEMNLRTAAALQDDVPSYIYTLPHLAFNRGELMTLLQTKRIVGSVNLRTRLSHNLIIREEEVRKTLETMNTLDRELFEYAKTLVETRLSMLEELMELVNDEIHSPLIRHALQVKFRPNRKRVSPNEITASSDLSICDGFAQEMKNLEGMSKLTFGVFQPPGHKGP